MILYRYSKEKFYVGHSGELKGKVILAVRIFKLFNRFKLLLGLWVLFFNQFFDFDIFLFQVYKLY